MTAEQLLQVYETLIVQLMNNPQVDSLQVRHFIRNQIMPTIGGSNA